MKKYFFNFGEPRRIFWFCLNFESRWRHTIKQMFEFSKMSFSVGGLVSGATLIADSRRDVAPFRLRLGGCWGVVFDIDDVSVDDSPLNLEWSQCKRLVFSCPAVVGAAVLEFFEDVHTKDSEHDDTDDGPRTHTMTILVGIEIDGKKMQAVLVAGLHHVNRWEWGGLGRSWSHLGVKVLGT